MNKKCFVFIVAVVFLASCQKQPISQSQPGAKQNNPSSLNPEVRQNYGQRPQPQQETWFFGLFKRRGN